MSSKSEKDKAKQLQDKCQSVLNSLLRDEDNKYCVDCDSKGPRWASWNIGVFLCIRCAGIHRNLGVHISKVKSVNLDSWTPEQVVSLQQMGNSRARAVYEANLPDNFRRPQNDSSLESFIRAKYEHKKYIAREWVPPPLPKVNWEKEIDEENEKKKKKTVVERKPQIQVEVPQLPKPKNPSPKPGRTVIPETKKENNDLLGLQNGDEFGSFLSNDEANKKKDDTGSVKSEEESFFNQTLPAEKEKVKLTKDSILALYGNTPTSNFQFASNRVPYAPNGPVQPGYTAGNYPATGAFPLQNGMPFNGTQQQFGQWNGSQFGQVAGMPNQFTQYQGFQPPSGGSQFPVGGQFVGQYQSAAYNVPQQPQPTPNPFYGTSNLQQQFGNMNLNNSNQTTNSSLATNLWP